MIRKTPKQPYKGLKRTPMKRKPPKVESIIIERIRKSPFFNNPNKPRKTPQLLNKPPKKQNGLKIRIDPLDSLFSLYVRTRDNFTCQRCGVKSKNVQCAHFIGRRNQNCRYLESNCTTLCFACHQFFHANPQIFVEWTKKRLGEKGFELLLAQERIICKPDKKAIELYLKAKLAELSK